MFAQDIQGDRHSAIPFIKWSESNDEPGKIEYESVVHDSMNTSALFSESIRPFEDGFSFSFNEVAWMRSLKVYFLPES